VSIAEHDRGAGEVRGVFKETTDHLMSYRYLGCSSVLIDREHAEGRMRIRRDMRTGGGALRTAPVAIAMLDTAGINIDRFYHAACTHIDVHLVDPGLDVRELRTLGTVVREARTAVFTEARFEDAGVPGRLLGMGTVGWSIIGPTPPGFEYTDPGSGVEDSPDLPPLAEPYEAHIRSGGGYRIEGLSLRIGTDVLHHGPILVANEAAALDVVSEAVGSTALAVDTASIRLVRAGKHGPFVATAQVVGTAGAVYACHSEMRDEGAGGAIVATGFLRIRSLD
jgi:acyl-coenzyme A thioesterase PaaI-like protein